MHKLKNHISNNFKLYFFLIRLFQWIFLLGFILLGLLGMWFFSILALIGSVFFYLMRIKLKQLVVKNFIHRLDKLKDPAKILKILPMSGSQRRRIRRKHERKSIKK